MVLVTDYKDSKSCLERSSVGPGIRKFTFISELPEDFKQHVKGDVHPANTLLMDVQPLWSSIYHFGTLLFYGKCFQCRALGNRELSEVHDDSNCLCVSICFH